MIKKKNILILAFILITLLGVCFIGCGRNRQPAVLSTEKAKITEAGKEREEEKAATKIKDAATEMKDISTEIKHADKQIKYELKTETFTYGKIAINYPQVVNMTDSAVQNNINEIIKGNALKDKDELAKVTEEVTYELTYDVMYTSENLLSIKYEGYSFFKGAAHPNNFIYTTNIDIEKQEVLKLKDFVNIDEDFVNIFKNGKYISMGDEEITSELKAALTEELNQTDTNGWINRLNNADTAGVDNYSGVYSCLTRDSLVISIGVPHFMGDYAVFKINYEDLSKHKKIKK
ncbi:MAG TPA: DUF4163 domain-containing protein [Clostridiales bacterium]|nr:DUF4163 domain-containing protein [Clostridiales bacterium]